MKLPLPWVSAKRRERKLARMSRRAFMGAGLAAGLAAGVADANTLWMKKPPASPFFATVSDASSLQTLLNAMRASPATYAGKTIGVLDGDYSGGSDGLGARFNASGIAALSTVLFYGVGDATASLVGMDISTSSNLIWQRIKVFRAAYDGINSALIYSTGATNCGFADCDIGSTKLNTYDYRFKVSGAGGAGSFADNEAVFATTSLQVPKTSATASGNYVADGSGGGVFVIANSTSPSPSSVYATEIGKWNSKVLQNAAGTAWVQLGASCNVSAPIAGSAISLLIGISGDCTGLYLHNNNFHDLRWSFAGNVSGCDVKYNDLTDLYQSFFDLEKAISDADIQFNTGQHIWCTHYDGSPSTSGAHCSIFGISVSSNGRSSNNKIWANVFVPGFHRFDLPANQGGGLWTTPSGPEMNDQGAEGLQTGIGGCIGGTGGVSSTSLVITTGPSSTASPKIAVGMSVRYEGGPYDDSVTILSQSSGSAGQAGTYVLSAPLTIPAGTHVTITTVNDSWTIQGNLILAGDPLGWEFAYAKNCKFLWNTIMSSLDYAATVGINRHDLYPGCQISKNVTNSMSTRNPPGIISPDVYTNSSDNIYALASSATGSAANYAGLYNGLAGKSGDQQWQKLDAAGALEAYTPKITGRIASGYGHSAHVNFVTKTTSFPADPAPPSSNVANGINTNGVHFDGATYSKWSGVSGAPLLGFADGKKITLVTQIRLNPDGSDDGTAAYIHTAKNSAFLIKRNTTGTITLTLNSVGAINAVVAQTSFTVNGADGWVTLVFTVDIANYKIYALKNNFLDPMLGVSVWTGLDMYIINGTNNDNIGSNYSTPATSAFKGDMGVISVANAFVDPSTPSGMGKFIAQDNKPVDYGATGATLYGTAAAIAINDDFTVWNSPGVNPPGGTRGTGGLFSKVAGTYTAAA